MIVFLKSIHLLALLLGGTATITPAIAMRAIKRTGHDGPPPPPLAMTLRIAGMCGLFAIILLWITGLALYMGSYAGADLGLWFVVKLLAATAILILSTTLNVMAARAARTGTPANPKLVKPLGRAVRLLLIVAVVTARELQQTGEIDRVRKSFRKKGSLPPVTIMNVIGADEDGDLILAPAKWEEDGPAPKALYVAKKGGPALTKGDKILAKLSPVKNDPPYEARLIRKLGGHDKAKILGIYRTDSQGGRILPVDKKNDREWVVNTSDANGAQDGELVEVAKSPARDHRPP